MTAMRLCIVFSVILLLFASVGRADWPAVTLEPADGKPIDQPTPVTFGMVFKPGEWEIGPLKAMLAGQAIESQADVKRRWPDGSVKHAVISLAVPKLDKATRLELVEEPPPTTAAAFGMAPLANVNLPPLVAEFRFPDGAVRTATMAKALQGVGEHVTRWLHGWVVVEEIATTRPTDGQGQPDADLAVQFHVRHYPRQNATRLAVVVEKDADIGNDGGIVYDLAIKSGDKVLAEAKNVQQPDYTRCRQVVWLGPEPKAIRVKYDAKSWAAAGLIPNYDFSLQAPEAALAGLDASLAKTKRGLFENGIVTAYFPMTGGRPDIGVLPRWTVFYLLTMDARAERVMLDSAERAAYVPIHMRRMASGRVPLHGREPKLWFDYRARGPNKFRASQGAPRAEVKPVFSPDIAHQPELVYVPYLITGDRYYLDELYAWATYSVLNNGYRGPDGTVTTGQARASAWGLRTVAAAAILAPDGDPELADFNDRIDKTLKSYIEFLTGKDAWPLKTFFPQLNEQGYSIAPWQHDYLICAADFLARAGFKQAETLRNELLDFSMGRFTHAPEFDPQYGLGYWWVVGERDRQTKAQRRLATWKELFEKNCRGKKADWADYAGGYGDLALAAAAVAVRTAHPSGRGVYDYLFERMPNTRKSRPAAPEWALSPEPVK